MTKIKTLLLSGAAFAIAAQAGQNFNIQFPFRTPAGDMPAGRYFAEVRSTAFSEYIMLSNVDTGVRKVLVPTSPVINVRGTEAPRLEFVCGESGCDLKRLWRDGSSGYELRQRKLTPAEKERMAATARTESVGSE